MKIRIDNWYSNGHESTQIIEVAGSEPTLAELTESPDPREDDWWQDNVFDFTGDGTGLDSDLEFYYTATIIEAKNADLIGQEHEWGL